MYLFIYLYLLINLFIYIYLFIYLFNYLFKFYKNLCIFVFIYLFIYLFKYHYLFILFLCAEAIKNIIQYLGLQPCERSDKVPEGKSSHTLFLAGVYRGGHDALVRAKLALDSSAGVTMQLTVRSTDPSVSEVLASAIGS
jgi:hypothetical protein